jgi:hypothetical protein
VDVTELAEVLGYLETLDAGMFDERYPPSARAGREGSR